MKTSRKGLTPLTVLRIDGPLDTTTLAELIDEPWVTVLKHCQDLEDVGLLRYRRDQTWDVTKEGDSVFKRSFAKASVGAAS